VAVGGIENRRGAIFEPNGGFRRVFHMDRSFVFAQSNRPFHPFHGTAEIIQ
jgi:hypothetical protein